MKQKAILVAFCVFFVIGPNLLSEEDKINIKIPLPLEHKSQTFKLLNEALGK